MMSVTTIHVYTYNVYTMYIALRTNLLDSSDHGVSEVWGLCAAIKGEKC